MKWFIAGYGFMWVTFAVMCWGIAQHRAQRGENINAIKAVAACLTIGLFWPMIIYDAVCAFRRGVR